MQTQSLATAHAGTAIGARAGTAVPALLAALLGLFLLWAWGSPTSARSNNAAHDTRHSNAFPCH